MSAPMTPREALEFLWRLTPPEVGQSEARAALFRTIEQHEAAEKVVAAGIARCDQHDSTGDDEDDSYYLGRDDAFHDVQIALTKGSP